LYFNYNYTQSKLENADEERSFFVRYRKWTDINRLVKLAIVVSVFLLIPCIVVTATESSVTDTRGDGCDKKWSDIVLTIIVAIYACIFCFFAWGLRQVFDSFKIKEELKFTGIVVGFAVVPWLVFNNFIEDVNNDVFPFSTLFLVLACAAAHGASIIWPVYRSIFQPPSLSELKVPELNSLAGLLSHKDGFEAFKQHLSSEFSVENLLFWKDCEDFSQLRRGQFPALLKEAQRIYTKFIVEGAPFQVNLPAALRLSLERDLKTFKKQLGTETEPRYDIDQDEDLQRQRSDSLEAIHICDVFDAAQKNIYSLMESDSYTRFRASPPFLQLSEHFRGVAQSRDILLQMSYLDPNEK